MSGYGLWGRECCLPSCVKYVTLCTLSCVICYILAWTLRFVICARYVCFVMLRFIVHAGPPTCLVVSNTYLLLTEFEGRTVSYGPSFFPFDLWPKPARSARAINRRGKYGGSVTYSTDRYYISTVSDGLRNDFYSR